MISVMYPRRSGTLSGCLELTTAIYALKHLTHSRIFEIVCRRGLLVLSVLVGASWSGSKSAISMNSPDWMRVTSLGGMGGIPAPMHSSASLIPLVDLSSVLLSISATCCSALPGGSRPTAR